ncbi:putative oxidoreductase YusZ [Pleurostoma richardsiae]|uniref:Oxidoreductase YusZ n=1 Tax=Pleurostoma richardsiae TaxID=41990 RepID=A0AA38RN14_9PEZI|nr:putative oxidoreductase YusZ [Pleurostoma richardsiae]
MAKQLVWLVTGCSSGFGDEFVRQILSRGDRAVATARKPERIAHLEAVGAAILPLDVTDSQETIDKTIARAIDIYGRIDVLVNNAGYIVTGAWEDLEYKDFLAQFETNVFGTIKVTKAVLPHLRQRKEGVLVFIGSRSGWCGDPFCGPYSGSKFALEGLVECLRLETEPLGIRTLMIDPGRFRTNFLTVGNNLQISRSQIPEYAEMSEAFVAALAREDRAQPGDVAKGVKVIIDLVRKEGCAEGRDVPWRLPIGTDSYESIKEKCEDTLKVIEEWKDVITGTDY